VLVGLFPIFFAQYWAKDLPPTTSTLYLGLANSLAGFVVMILSPWLGALADRTGTKKRWLAAYTVLGVIATTVLAGIGQSGWLYALVAFVLGSIGFFGSSTFHDALIVRVSTAAESDRVSSLGYALGYLGGGLIFIVDVAMVLHPTLFGLPDAVAAMRAAFVSVAVWWILFSIPLFRQVPEAPPVAEASGWQELYETLRKVLRNAPVMRFLIAYWLYIDAIGTLQQMAVDFGAKLGLSSEALIKALLLVQFVSFPAAIGFGYLAGRIGTRAAIQLGLVVFTGVTLWAYTMRTEAQFFEMATVVGLVQGGVQALSRSYFSRLIPRERAGEYFGFYNMIGKFAAVLGPMMVGVVAWATHDQHLSIAVLAVFFVAGMILLSRVDDREARVAHG
jgi:UMF1 family MFS transporter